MIITLDGQSGTGKSTLAKEIAKKLDFKCLNTGMIYRALTHYFLSKGILSDNENAIINELKNVKIEISFNDDNQYVSVNGVDCTPFVSSSDVQKNVSLFSQILKLREKVTKIQREFALCNNIVVEGRDIGTHVFPDAEYKFFVTCDIVVRAKRRLDDLVNSGQNISLDEVIQSLKNRDLLDTTRQFSPLRRSEDAIDIDTSNKTISQSINEMLSYLK